MERHTISAPLPPSLLQSLYNLSTGTQTLPIKLNLAGKRIVCISDTHGQHRNLTSQLETTPADFLIHAGDFTRHGSIQDAVDFNTWLGELKLVKHKIVVNGNHESNAPWKKTVKEIMTNASFLCNESIELEGVKIYGTDFYWPSKDSPNPYFDLVSNDVDVLVSHGPPLGYLDLVNGNLNAGCPSLTSTVGRTRPRLVVSGHIHRSSGIIPKGNGWSFGDTTFVNAACMGEQKIVDKHPIILEFL
ncbi:Metallo-dependent phosphatase-like protein [Obelidium mucronatum]|nr:Metallo-dependent phosphatase-like protein [Obelidium mucronatum]